MNESEQSPEINNIKHIFRFILVGILNTGFSYLIYAIMLYAGLAYQWANLIAMLTGILFSFKTQGRFVFLNTDNKLFGKFVISWIVIYLWNISLIGWLISFGFDAYWAGAMALPFSVILSYLTQRYFVFRRGDQLGSDPN
ncbi:GtrA family protein [Rhodoferax sp.]|uniref:GtrA family protein n=1 Tax=Rhodoferax sp. TaxID=50421 RepID=UPI001A0A5523|nr:GtrA family protein [Rhodoferax sp.]MBE0475130.1 GtrA family protein [Rhodoferax sp.]